MARVSAGFLHANDFAKQLGIDQNNYTPYERAASYPPPIMLVDIKRLTGVPMDWLLFGDPTHLTFGMIDKLKDADKYLIGKTAENIVEKLRPSDPLKCAVY